MSEVNGARVWLVAALGTAPTPTDHPTVRDDLMRTWRPSPDGRYTTGEGRHHAAWDELRAQHDLVEVTEVSPITLASDTEARYGGLPSITGRAIRSDHPAPSSSRRVEGAQASMRPPRALCVSCGIRVDQREAGHTAGAVMTTTSATQHDEPPGGLTCQRCRLITAQARTSPPSVGHIIERRHDQLPVLGGTGRIQRATPKRP